MSYVSAIVLGAGLGLRYRSRVPKLLLQINSQPVIIYCLKALSIHPCIKEIILVVNAKNAKGIIKQIRHYGIAKISRVVKGGLRRQDSLKSGLLAINSNTELVLIHDAARPFIGKEIISSVLKEAKNSGAAIIGVPVKATIKSVKVSKYQGVKEKIIVEKTLNRDNLWEIQTPQVFKKDLILKAYQKFGNIDVTDDAMLVEKLKAPVSIVLGSYNNIKITTPEDLVIAEAILKKRIA